MMTQEVLNDFKDEKQDRKLKKCRKQRRQRSSKKSRRLRKLDRECRYNSEYLKMSLPLSNFKFLETSDDETRLKMDAADKKGSCKRKDMRIDFDEIGWSSWIIAPSSFDAFYCAGQCGYAETQVRLRVKIKSIRGHLFPFELKMNSVYEEK